MSRVIVNDLIEQYKHTFRIINEEIERFSEGEWLVGISFFQVPVKQAIHLLDCLEYYFSDGAPETYVWGHKFGGGWWELSDGQLPNVEAVLDYAEELESKIIQHLSTWKDSQLSEPSPIDFQWAKTRLGLYTYALKHTLHHHGQLAVLSVYHGHDGGSWE